MPERPMPERPTVERRPSYCTLCRSRCGCTAVVEGNRLVAVEPLAGHPTGGALCAKGRAAPEIIGSPRRLTRPLKRTNPRSAADPGWVEISWDAALDEIAGRLGAIRAADGAEAVAFAVTTPSGTPMVDSFEWVERFIRLFGSPNLIYAVEVCGWHKDYAHALTFGRGIGIPDYDQADTIVLWGHNPVRTWLAQASRIAEARRRGARLVVIDPKPNGSGEQADLWLRIRPGSDGALAMGAIRHLIETDGFDREFVARWTNAPMLVRADTGRLLRAEDLEARIADAAPDAFIVADPDGRLLAYDTRQPGQGRVTLTETVTVILRNGKHVAARPVFALLTDAARDYSIERVAELTWLDAGAIEQFYALVSGAPRLAYHSWTGVGQQTNATATERALATLYALTGAVDRPGGNLWTVPPPTRSVNDYDLLPAAQRAKALGLADLPLGPPCRGWITARDFARAVLEGEPYKVKALMSFGTNFVVSQGHSSRNRACLQALDFHVHVDMFLNPTAENADIVLPANLPWERDALKIGFEITQEAVETIQFRPKMLEAPGECRADYRIAADLAVRLGFGEQFFGGDIETGWDHQLAPLGVTVEDLRRDPTPRRFPQNFDFEKFSIADADGHARGFPTASRRVELYSEQMLDHGYPPLPDYVPTVDEPTDARFPLMLTTAKSGWFVHSSHRHVASLRRKSPDPGVEISPALARARGLAERDWAIVTTATGSARLRVRLNPALDSRVVVAEFGWWEDCPPLGLPGAAPASRQPSANINDILSDDERDPVSGSVPLRAVICDIAADATANIGRWAGKRGFHIRHRPMASRDVAAFELVPDDGGPLPRFRPGQHVIVSLPGTRLARAYSLTGSGEPSDHLGIAVRRNPDAGANSLSRAIHELAAGARLELEAPEGTFTPPLSGPRPVVLLAAGVGITAFIGYLAALEALPPDRVAKTVLVHACRNGREHPFARHLKRFRAQLPGLALTVAYSQPDADDRAGRDFDLAGRYDPATLRALVPEHPLVYLCGSPGFTRSMTERLVELGLPRFDIFEEAFTSPPEVPSTLAPRTIHVAGTGRSFVWTPESGTLLDAGQSAGIALPSGCRAGQCESCAVRIESGQVAHLGNYAGDACLTCQAVPLTDVTLAL
jgi:anaerobic selenocysteine-containing dehydrogenase/ferredoxin-NADP reductase